MRKALNLPQVVSMEALWLALGLASSVLAIIVITYGADSLVLGAHDAFHDFRHAIGMGCH